MRDPTLHMAAIPPVTAKLAKRRLYVPPFALVPCRNGQERSREASVPNAAAAIRLATCQNSRCRFPPELQFNPPSTLSHPLADCPLAECVIIRRIATAT